MPPVLECNSYRRGKKLLLLLLQEARINAKGLSVLQEGIERGRRRRQGSGRRARAASIDRGREEGRMTHR